MPRKTGLSIPSPRSRHKRPVDDEAASRFEAATEAKGAGVVALHPQPAAEPTSAEPSPCVSPKQVDRACTVTKEPKPNENAGGSLGQNRRGTLQRPYVRKDGVATKSTAFHLPIDLVKRLRIAAAVSGHTQSSIAEAAISSWLENNMAD